MASVVKPGLGPWKRRAPAATKAAVVLTQQRVYVMPSRMGGVFSLTLFLMLLGSINYNLGLGYVLTFLLGGLGMVSLLHTWRNLAGLDIRPGRPERVFAGDHLRFTVSIRNPTGLARFAIGLRRGHEVAHFVNVGPRGEAESFVEMVAKQRGWLEPGRMEIATNTPLGLFRAWSYMHFEQWALVYPRPEPAPPPLPLVPFGSGTGATGQGSEEDFEGLRAYRPGDPLKRVYLKSLARPGAPTTKEFAGGPSPAAARIDWRLCPDDMDAEARLSRLTAWILRAEQAGVPWSLHMPGTDLAPGHGPAQRDQALELLALYGR